MVTSSRQASRPSTLGKMANEASTLGRSMGWLKAMTMGALTGMSAAVGSTASRCGAVRAMPNETLSDAARAAGDVTTTVAVGIASGGGIAGAAATGGRVAV